MTTQKFLQYEQKKAKLLQQQSDIERELQELSQTRNQALKDVLTSLPITDIDPHVLIGGMLYVLNESRRDPDVAQRWQREGRHFLSRQKKSVPSSDKKSNQTDQGITKQSSDSI